MPSSLFAPAPQGARTSKALTMPDLAHIILSFLSARDVATAARVSREWMNVANRMLWISRDVSLSALLGKLIFLTQNCKKVWGPTSQATAATVSSEAWAQFVHSADVITRLRLDTKVDKSAINLLRALLKPTGLPLCPRLRHVRLSMTTARDTTIPQVAWMLLLLFRPPVTSLSVEIDTHSLRSKFSDAILSRVSAIDPSELTLGHARTLGTWYEFDCRRFKNLRVLRLCDVTLSTWHHLKDLPHLAELYVTETEPGTSEGPLEGHGLGGVVFPSLETIHLDCTFLFTAAVQTTVMPLLRTFVGGHLAKQVKVPMVELAERSVHLEEIVLQFDCEALTPRAVKCLSNLGGLRIVRLGGVGDRLEVDDDALGTLAESLPMLQHFSLVLAHTADNETIRITVVAFIAFVQYCDALKTLELPLNLTSFDELDTSTYAHITLSFSIVDLTIRQLVLPSRIYDAAHFMAQYCPEVFDLKLRDLGWREVKMEPFEVRGRQTLVDEFRAHQDSRRLLAPVEPGWRSS